MKRGTLRHYKTNRLAIALSGERPCDRAEALGIVEALCNHVAPELAPRGDIGKLTDQEIADACMTTRDPAKVIAGLLASGWLDTHPKHRLVIHDYAVHADTGVKNRLKGMGLDFVSNKGRTRVQLGSDPGSAGVDLAKGLGTGNGKAKAPDPYPEDHPFVRFWDEYPRRKKKQEAFKAWTKLNPDPDTVEKIVAALEWQRREWAATETKFIPLPASYLNGRRWTDEPDQIPIVSPKMAPTMLALKRFAERKV